jgi:hypothetical protein
VEGGGRCPVVHEQFHKAFAVPKGKPVLLLLDTHQSRLVIGVLDLAKEKLVVLLSFPPHTTQKLKPYAGSFVDHSRRS